ncbi:MAG: hypothetical protein ACK55Z_11870, partial [bacterium]
VDHCTGSSRGESTLGSASSPHGTSRSNTVDTIRVGRRRTFCLAPALLTSYPCTDLSASAHT